MLPILKTLFRNSAGALLAALQVAVTLAVCSNALFIVVKRIEYINQDTGIDKENIVVYSARGFGENFSYLNTIDNDLRSIRAEPGIVSASFVSSTPLGGSGSSSGWRISASDKLPSTALAEYETDDTFMPTLGLQLLEGRKFTTNEISYREANGKYDAPKVVMVNRALADEFFPNESAVGKLVYNNLGEGSEVIGVVDGLPGPWPSWQHNAKSLILPVVQDSGRILYLIRTQPGQRDSLIPTIEKLMQQQGRDKVQMYIGPMTEVIGRSYEADNALVVILSLSIVLVLLVTAFGLVGLASSSVRQRTKQIGTRRALGARKIDILLYFVTENWLTTSAGILLGLVLTQWINYVFVTNFELEPLDARYVILGVIAVWSLGLLSVLGPAIKALSIPPALATRSV